MKKNILIPTTLLILILGLVVFFLIYKKGSVKSVKTGNIANDNLVENTKLQTEKRFLFVPYWALDGNIDSMGFDELIYFGIKINKDGIDTNESGYQNIGRFVNYSDVNSKKLLTVRILDQELGSLILKDKKLQNKVIRESIDIALKNSFSGLVLDFEIQGIPFEAFTKSISDFYSEFYDNSHKKSLAFYITLYGDTFYRIRPYDVGILAKESDGIFVMAYDLHKANGDPGPNFPLFGKEVFGYDFKSMVSDFAQIVPREKLTVIFGLFGYDWKIDEVNKSKEPAQALTLNQIKGKFLSGCVLGSCKINRDNKSSETNISYIDSDNNKHIVWLEDMESVSRKLKYLYSDNVGSYGFWAYSYY